MLANGPVDAILSVPPRWLAPLASMPTHNLPPPAVTAVGIPPTFTVDTTVSRRGSIRDTLPEYWFATHTDAALAITADGPLPTGIVATTLRLAGSIFETVEARLFATHRSPSANAREAGPVPTCTLVTFRPEAGSTLTTVALSYAATHSAPAPNAIADGVTRSGIVRRSTRFGSTVVGSSAYSARVDESATHNRPAPKASASGLPPASGILWVTPPVVGLSRRTVAPSVFATHTDPSPHAMLAGLPPTGTRSTDAPVAVSICDTVPSLASATQSEPDSAQAAAGVPVSGVAVATRSDPVFTPTTPLAPAARAGCRLAEPTPSVNAVAINPPSTSTIAAVSVRWRRDPRAGRNRGGPPSDGSCWRIRRCSSRSSGPGSKPSSSPRSVRAVWNTSSASVWRPDL